MAAALPQEYAFLIFEALQKVAEVIVRGRVNLAEAHFTSTGAAQSTQQPRRFRLNLEVEEVPFVRERLRSWRDNLFTPLVLDINFVERDGATGVLRHTDLVERWYVLFEPPSSPGGGASAPIEGGAGQQAQIKRAQKKLSVMLRTLYAFLRLIPTHQLVRALAHAGPTCGARLEAGLNAGLLNSLRGDMEALLDGGVFRSHRFQDVATPLGTFRMTTAYRASSDFVIPEAPAQRMIEPGQIIADYVGVAPTSAPHPSAEQFQQGGGSEGKGGGDYREGGPSGLSQALRQHEEDSAHDMLLLLSPARHSPAAVPHGTEQRPYPPADPPQSPPYLISYPRSLTSPSSRQLHLQQHHSYSHPHHYQSPLLGPQPTDPKLSRCPSSPIPVPYPSLPYQVPRHVGGSAPSSGLSSPFLTPPPAPSIPHFSHGAMPHAHTHTLSRLGSHPMDIPEPHPPRHRSSLSSPSALPFPLSSSPLTQPLTSPPLPPPSGTRYASTSAVGAQQQQQQQQQQHHLGTRARSLDSAGFGAISPLFGLRRKTSEDRHPSSAETSPARHDPASSDSTLTKALGGLTLGPTSPFQQQQQQRQPPRSPMTPTTAKGRYGATLPSTGSTPPFSVGVWHQHGEQVGPSAPPPLPIGYSKLGCSPPFSVQTTTLLSRSPQQPPPPSPPTLAKAARSTSLDSSASRSYTTYGSRDGGLGLQAGGGGEGVGVTSSDQASTLPSNRQYHQTFSSSTGGSGSSLLGGGSAGSSGSGGNSGGSLAAAPSLDTLGESPFKNSGTALLGSSLAVTGSLPCTPTRSSTSCVAGGDLRSAPGLAGSAYALRSLECLQAEEAVSRSLGASSDEDLPFAVPSRGGGRSTYMGGSSSSTSSGSSITGSRTSSQLLVGGGGSSSLRPPLAPTHTPPASAVVGPGGTMDGGSGGGVSMTSSKVAAARLAEQCARAPPLQIFSPPSTYSSLSFTAAGGGDGGRGQQMMQVGDATGGATGGGSTLEGSPRTPRHTGSSMVGTLSSSRASGPSVESLKEDLRAFREFSSGLGRVKTLSGDHK